MTRSRWYSIHHGGSWRKARKRRQCDQPLCLQHIEPGQKYFDTNQIKNWPTTKTLCAQCAEENV